MKMQRHIIAIDLGAQDTGVVLHSPSVPAQGALLRLSKNQQQWSQEPRRGARHLQRRLRRRQLAKRLLRALLLQNGGDISRKHAEFLGGIVNRRGFNYAQFDIADEYRDLFETDKETILHELLPDFFGNKSVQDAVNTLAPSEFVEQTSSIFEKPLIGKKVDKTAAAAKAVAFLANLDKEEEGEQKRFYKEMCKQWQAMKQEGAGHLQRSEYLKNIHADIVAQAKSDDAFAALLAQAGFDDVALFARAVGHIANLPLRVLRRYFAVKDKKDVWDGKRMRELVLAEVRGWQCGKGEDKDENKAQNRAAYIASIEESADILAAWQEVLPDKTVPPFESQGNRNPPKCMSLLIKSEVLRKHAFLQRVVDAFFGKMSAVGYGVGGGQAAKICRYSAG